MIKKLAKSIREYKLPSILTCIFIVLEAVIECIIPFVTARMIDNLQHDVDVPFIVIRGAILVGLALLSLDCGGIAAYTCSRASAGFAKNLREDIFFRIQSFSFENIDRFSSTSLVTRLTTDITNVQISYMMIIRIAIRAPLMLIFSIVMAYIMGGMLATSFVVIIPFLAFGLILIARKAMPAFRSVFKKYDKMNESVEENVRNMRVVKGFAREEYEKQKFKNASEDIMRDFTKAERIVALNNPLMQICIYGNMVFVMYMGSKLIISQTGKNLFGDLIGVGELSAMLTYGMQILIQLMMLSMIYVILTISAESAKRCCEVLDEVPSMKERSNPVMKVENGSVDFENVSFKYSSTAEAYALEGVNLHIDSGMTVGIIGGTGSSKTSLIQLISRLYDVTEGSVKVAGIDVRNYDLVTLRDSVSVVLQKNLLFSGTIKENLKWGNENATDEEIEEACRIAQADEFIRSFPDGYDTFIEQGGTNVSGGQKQRLCIARALLKKPKILILDDSTSAVDTRTDALIRQGFASYINETTKIIIAQRVSSVEHADMIIVMDGGRIVNIGKHSDLMSSCEIYREVYEQQTRGGGLDEQ
ncbi:MAG: ABC transporter ATP-binding protein [Clostridia bacterium]|nr:ABC transporter ATP-binding protein [Clostridia bacterium]